MENSFGVNGDLQKMHAIEVPQWQIDEVLKRKKYYQQHPEELMSWEDAQKMIKLTNGEG
jgi:hypothetical protein